MLYNPPMKPITVIGGGLAGCEAALQIAKQQVPVILYEMRPKRMTEAHTTGDLAELVCSNSFGSTVENHASWILKEELRRQGGELIQLAFQASVPAGASLAVDRKQFSALVQERLAQFPNIEIRKEEVTQIPEGSVIIATGPLTTLELSRELSRLAGGDSLFFYDAISPIVSTESLDLNQIYLANRYGKGDTPDFLNIPLSKEQYFALVEDLLTGEVMLPHDFEEEKYFEGCMPVEAIAARGPRTLAFGPMRPVGLEDPKTGKRPYAVIQLRAENRHRTAYNMVGFQTKLKYPEQLRIFRKLPGLANAEFLRLGSMHRNTYLNSPKVLLPSLQLKKTPQIWVAGQLTGTEGYLESTATGWLAGQNCARHFLGKDPLKLPPETMLGALLHHITDPTREHFQPMNANMGILPPLEVPPKDRPTRNLRMAERSFSLLMAVQ